MREWVEREIDGHGVIQPYAPAPAKPAAIAAAAREPKHGAARKLTPDSADTVPRKPAASITPNTATDTARTPTPDDDAVARAKPAAGIAATIVTGVACEPTLAATDAYPEPVVSIASNAGPAPAANAAANAAPSATLKLTPGAAPGAATKAMPNLTPNPASKATPNPASPTTPNVGRKTVPRPARRRSVTVNLAESPLGWLRSRGLVDARQFEAGERLRGDYETAALAPRVTMRWGATRVDAGGSGRETLDPTERQIAAKRRFDAATGAVGPGLRDVLWRVVCAGEGLPMAERALGWPVRSGKLVLGLALDRLADHYGLR